MAPWWKPAIYVWYSLVPARPYPADPNDQRGKVILFWTPMGDDNYARHTRVSNSCFMVPGTVDPLDDDYCPID